MEKRSHTRYPFSFLTFLFKAGFSDLTPFAEGKVLNLSLHGCKITCQTDLALNETLALRLYVPNLQPQLLIHTAKVVWKESNDLGLKFLNLQQGEQQRLTQFIQSLEQLRLGKTTIPQP